MLSISVDNPGRGNCAYYAWAIGLIDIIKHELHKHNKSHVFDTWCQFVPEIAAYENDIRSFNNKNQNKNLLETLQASLRQIVYLRQFSELDDGRKKACVKAIEASQNGIANPVFTADAKTPILSQRVYIKFAEIFWHYYYSGTSLASNYPLDSNYNDLAKSAEIKKLAKDLASRCKRLKPQIDGLTFSQRQTYLDGQIFNEFSKDVFGLDYRISLFDSYNPNSKIVKGLNAVKNNYFWGTHGDLNILAEAFDVNFHYLVDGNPPDFGFTDTYGKPIVTINNQGNFHWTTMIQTSHSAVNDSTQKYNRHAADSLLQKKEISDIFRSYTNGFISFFGRNHMEMAKKIIEACNDNEQSVASIVDMIQQYTENMDIHFNHDSSFKKRANYIFTRNEFYNGFQEEQLESDFNLGLE